MARKKFSFILNFLKFSLRSTLVRSLLNSLKIEGVSDSTVNEIPNCIKCHCCLSSVSNIFIVPIDIISASDHSPAENAKDEVEHEE